MEHSFTIIRLKMALSGGGTPIQMIKKMHTSIRRFEQVFRQIVCRTLNANCEDCRHGSICPFYLVFSQMISSDPAIVRRHQKPPLPIAFSFSHNGHGAFCMLTVAGSAVTQIATLVEAFERVLSDIGITICNTWCVDYHNGLTEIGGDGRLEFGHLVLLEAMEVFKQQAQDSDVLRLEICSPLRLIHNGSICRILDLPLLIRFQMRRISAMAAYYGEGEFPIDYKVISALAGEVSMCRDRTSFGLPSWNHDSHRTAGLAGCVDFRAAPDVAAVLALGSLFNAGKGAAWGMGAYRVTAIHAGGDTTAVL